MNFGIEKCAKVTLKKGKQVASENIKLEENFAVQDLAQEKNYKYLGVEEGGGISHSKMKEKIRNEFCKRVRKVLKTELNSKNKLMAINCLAVPVVTYGFNVIDWNMNEIKGLDIKVRKLLTMHRMHHPKADKDRIYLPRSEGGRGLVQLENAYKLSTLGLKQYLESSKEWLLNSVYQHQKAKKLFSITKDDKKFATEIKLTKPDRSFPETYTPVEKAKAIKLKAKALLQKGLKEKWEDKNLHGQFAKRINQENISKNLSNQWLQSSGLKGETEGLIMAAQDQSLPTRNYQTNITKQQTDDMCRLCKSKKETIDHLICGCSSIAATEYLQRHNKIAQYIHWKVCRSVGMTTSDMWYNHQTEAVMENNNTKVLWDFQVHTDRPIRANRPDIIIKNKKTQCCLLIDVAVPGDANVANKEFEKKYKYKDLELEIQKMWKVKTKVIPIVIGALGLVSKDLEKYLLEIPAEVSSKEIQKIALMGTAHILRKTLSM